ncbi:MAG: hypothetical protein JWN66_3408 [Sphingomonas bacterium]|uniref:hypothetical protein n=1 Tax=Sphingomonas bacterium TaxID=1895847 RepID=UPI00260BC276|nr:hypothetical protein [Sphingomonas bacterium]MDB5706292.1 hypothetical protein [Sphingomonas bacterium]
MEDEIYVCDRHGDQPTAFVCKHITGAPLGETVGFASYRPDDENDLRDAWCDTCDAYLQANGGEWVEDAVEVPGGIDMLCAECYRLRQDDAVKAGRRVIHDA